MENSEDKVKKGKAVKEEKQLKYDAFISYRHTVQDIFVAQLLHKELEAFKLPRNVKRKLEEGQKTRISRVFRDKDELPLASNLADHITKALEVSDFLIVICSPRLPESLWCRKEIQTFIALHGRERVLAVLIEGEPDESFPEELLYSEEEVLREDGSREIVKIPIEPLAADVRGGTQKEIKKKLKEEIVRLAAPMFDCSYDELKQRHRERKIRRIITAAAVVSAVGVAFGSVSTAMALKIHGQNTEITRQNRQIQNQNNQIAHQYREEQRVNKKMQAEEAFQLLEEGDRVGAINTAAHTMSRVIDADEIYVAEAEYALSESLGVYRNGDSIVPEFMLKHDADVDFMKLSPDGNMLLTVDDAKEIYLWDIETGRLLLKNDKYTQDTFMESTDIIFLDNERLAYLGEGKVTVFTIDGEEETDFYPDVEESNIGEALSGGEECGYLFYILPSKVMVFDSNSLELCFTVKGEEGKEFLKKSTFTQDGKNLVLARENEEEEKEVLLVDLEQGVVKKTIPLPHKYLEKLWIRNDILYILNNSEFENRMNEDGTESAMVYDVSGRAIAVDLNSGEEKWHYEHEGGSLSNIAVSGKEGSDAVMLTSYGDIIGVHGSDGSGMGVQGIGSDIVRLAGLVDSDYFWAYTRNGRMLWVDVRTGVVNTVEIVSQFDCNSDNVKKIMNGNAGRVIMRPYSSREVTILRALEGGSEEVFSCPESKITDFEKSGNRFLMIERGNNVLHCFGEEGELWSTESEERIEAAVFAEEMGEKVILLEQEKVRILSGQTGEEISTWDIEDSPYEVRLYGSVLCQYDGQNLSTHDIITGEKLAEINLSEMNFNMWIDIFAVSEEGKYTAAIIPGGEKAMAIYEMSTGEKKAQMPVNAAYVETVFLNNRYSEGEDDREYDVYVRYKNNRLERYLWDGEKLTLEQTLDDLEYEVEEIRNQSGSYALLWGGIGSYVLKDYEIVARIPDCKAADFENGRVYTGDYYIETMYQRPFYTWQMLHDEAEYYFP